MRKVQRWRFLDVVVTLGAVSNSDHRMALLKMRIGKRFSRCSSKDELVRKFGMVKLQGTFLDESGRELPEGKFVSSVCAHMRSWHQAGTAQEKWDLLRDDMCSAARSKFGAGGRRQADCFTENENVQ